MTEPGGLFGGRYRLGPSLGVGGTSAVYQAEDVRDASGCQVAVKVLHPELCADERSRTAFLREAERLASLHQENIAAVLAWAPSLTCTTRHSSPARMNGRRCTSAE